MRSPGLDLGPDRGGPVGRLVAEEVELAAPAVGEVLLHVLTFSEVISFADAALFVCGFVNLLGVYLLLPVIKRDMKEYLADRRSGKLHLLGNEPTDGSTAVRPQV